MSESSDGTVTYRVMRSMTVQYNPKDYASIGPTILTDVAREMCKMSVSCQAKA